MRIPLRSSAIASFDYDEDTRRLDVAFTNGRTYSHEDVPPEVVEEFAASSSPGRFYNQSVKGVYG